MNGLWMWYLLGKHYLCGLGNVKDWDYILARPVLIYRTRKAQIGLPKKKKNKLYVIFSRYYLALWGQEEIVFIFWSNQTKLKNYPETIYSTSTRSIPSGEKSFCCKWPYTTNGRFLQVAKFLTNRNVNLEGGTYITKAIKGFRLPSDRFGGL